VKAPALTLRRIDKALAACTDHYQPGGAAMSRFERPFRSVGPIVLACFVTFATAATAHATTILIDLGPSSRFLPPGDFDLPFVGLNGTPLAGQPLSLDFVFADSKWITAGANSPSNDLHGVLLLMQTNNIGLPLPLSLAGTGSFLDEHGNSINGTMNLCCPGGTTTGAMTAALYSGAAMSQSNPLVGPFSYYGVHYDFTLPSGSGTTITSGNLRVVYGESLGDPVPDNSSSLALLAMGSCAVVLLRLRPDRRKS